MLKVLKFITLTIHNEIIRIRIRIITCLSLRIGDCMIHGNVVY